MSYLPPSEFKKHAAVVEVENGWVSPHGNRDKLKALIREGCNALYSALFGQDWWNSLADHHREALEWHFESRLAFLEGRKPEHLAYFPVWSRGHAKSSLAERMIVVDAVLSVAFDQPGFALYIGREKDKIKEHIGNIEQILSSEKVRFYAPSLSQVARNEETNQKRQWTGTFLHTQGKYVVKGGSIESAQAGSRINETRPTVICHQKGTPVYTDGQWQLVEDHPTARSRIERGLRVSLRGVPDAEVVTPEHRYWVREYVETTRSSAHYIEGATGWKEAKDLHRHCWIGLPIDMTVESPPSVSIFTERTERTASGQFVKGNPVVALRYKDIVPNEFLDPEWWWFFGYWWGDGHRTKTQIGITIADKDEHIFERLTNLLAKYKKPWHRRQKTGCFQVTFNSSWMARWLNSWRRPGKSRKIPPEWVERLPFDCQTQLIRGYVDADGWVNEKSQEVRLTSVHLDGLHCVRRILARLNVSSSIRKGVGPRLERFRSGLSWSQQKYDLRFQPDGTQFGWNNIRPQQRYKFSHNFISDGTLWSRVKDIEDSGVTEFIPITTESGTYLTHFGMSHNCPDDVDGREDSPVISQMRMTRLTKEILPMRQQNTLVFFAQNLISRYSVMYQIQSQQVQVLTNRKATKPIPAVIDLVTEQVTGEDGIIRDVYVSGKSTWPQVWDIDRINDEIQTEGLEAFKIECQHDVEARKEGLFHKNYNDNVHAISYSQFESVYGKDAWKHWFKLVANDWARTKTKYHANVAAFLAVSSADTVLPGLTFVIPFSFKADTAPADVAERLLSALTPYAYGENGNRATWRQLIDEAWKRMNAEQHFETVADRWAFEKDYYAKIIPKYSKKVLQAYQVRAGVMSHSEDKVREMFNTGFGFGFRPSNPGKTEGLESIDAAMRVDYSLEHPFPKFDEDGRVKGYSRFFVLCPDDLTKESIYINGTEVYPPVPYPETLKVDNLHDSDLFRYQMCNRRFLPPKLMETGERIDEPEKLHDDFGQLLQMVYITNLLKNIKLTPTQLVESLISPSVKENLKTARTSGDKLSAVMAYEFEKEIAEEKLGVTEMRYEDEWM